MIELISDQLAGNDVETTATFRIVDEGVRFGVTSPGGAVYWVGEAMGSVDFKDLDEIPSAVRETAVTLASNAAHTARLLAAEPYPAMSS